MDLTFKHNLKRGRHGWLRLTPAYSVKVVYDILERNADAVSVLDPFSGTGTTGLVCAEKGIACDLLELNPFLVWLAKAKTANYSEFDLADFRRSLPSIIQFARRPSADPLWVPPLANIERWWNPNRLELLASLYQAIGEELCEGPAKNLALLAFCRTMIEWSNAAFNHQSMSFKEQEASLFDEDETEQILTDFGQRASEMADAASICVEPVVVIRQADSRAIPEPSRSPYDLVITSPPYPNRMSYVRELRPYMYWLGYLTESREAGDLDWDAIGGTWGIATSRTEKWVSTGPSVPFDGFSTVVEEIGIRSKVLGNYVNRYFVDMTQHLTSLRSKVASGGRVFYVVGNSKFYETVVPVERIFSAMMEAAGFVDTGIQALRKRNSKKELVEYVVTARG